MSSSSVSTSTATKAMLVTPKTYLVGITTPINEYIEQYLEDTGQEQYEGYKDEGGLVSMFAKMCYKSLVVGKNSNISRVRDTRANLEAIIKSGHGSVLEHFSMNFITTNCSRVFCFVPDTEVLTLEGWKRVDSISDNDILLTMNPETGKATWNKPNSVQEFDYSGSTYYWETSQGCSPVVTNDHLIWAGEYDKRKNRGLLCSEIELKKIRVNDAYLKRVVVQNSIDQDGHDPEFIRLGGVKYEAASLYEWLGWLATDGNFDINRANKSTITQTKKKNWPEIVRVMNELFGTRWKSYGPYETEDGLTSRQFVINDESVTAWAKEMIGLNKDSRTFSPKLLKSNKRLLRVMVTSAIKGDGSVHKKNGHEVIYCPTQHNASQWQIIVSMLNKCAIIREDKSKGRFKKNKKSYILSISRKTHSVVKGDHWVRGQYTGKVYCPETKDGLVFVRNGNSLPVWSGNTHELVRHRVGTAFSQTSGRYVRLDDVKLIVPPEFEEFSGVFEDYLDNLNKTVASLEESVGLRGLDKALQARGLEPTDVLREEYGPVLGFNDKHEMPFARKKQLTSAIRRIAPNGQANEIAWSANWRTLRHLLELRTSRHAEWEIRHVFNEVAEIVPEFILMGGEFEEVDGLKEYTGLRV